MHPSPSPAPSPLISKSEYYSSLPWFRRFLAMLNWRPVVDYELREIEFDRREIEYKRREIEYRQRMQRLQNESEQLRIEEQQRKQEEQLRSIAHEQRMKQLNELDSKLNALLCSSSTSSTPPQSTHDNFKA